METVRVALIGAGWVAGQHLQVIGSAPGIEACGITSRTRSRAEELAAAHGLRVFDTAEEMVSLAKPDALMVLVSAESMHEVASEAIGFGLPLFVEKPAGLTPAENADLAEQATSAGVRTMVGFNRRYYSVMRKGLEAILECGPLLGVSVEGHERFWKIADSPGVGDVTKREWMFANGVHTVDLLRFFGGDATNVSSVAHSFRERNGDQFAAVMELESGAIGEYRAHWWSPGGWSAVLYGDGVTVEFRPLESARLTDRGFQTRTIEPDECDLRHKAGFCGQIVAFGEMVREGVLEPPGQDLFGALRTMRLAAAIARRETSA